MNPNEIKKALENLINHTHITDQKLALCYVLDYINELEAEADKIAEDYSNLMIEKDELFDEAEKLIENAKADAFKEFAERVKDLFNPDISYDLFIKIDNLVKEIVGDE